MRRDLLVVFGAAALSPGTVFAQAKPAPERAAKVVRVGILSLGTPATFQPLEKALVDAMREMGWVEGRNVVYDKVYADGDATRLPALAEALVSRAPGLIFTGGLEASQAALARTRTIPIVFGAATDPVENGLVRSLGRPGGNVTGMGNLSGELAGKRLQLLKQALPRITRVAVLVDSRLAFSVQEHKVIEDAGKKLGVTVTSAMVKEVAELDASIASLAKGRTEALLVTTAALILNQRKAILDLAARQRIPVVAGREIFAEEGALMSYGASITDQYRRAAQLADKVLKGARPAEIPVERPTRFELIVNLKTARSLGLTISESIVAQADRVIE